MSLPIHQTTDHDHSHRNTTQVIASKPSTLISPYGGTLVDLLITGQAHEELRAYANQLPSLQVS